MKIRIFSLTIIFSLLFSFIPLGLVNAHPGRTDSKGGHTCRTNCAKWGLETGEYHYHNGGSSTKKVTTKTPAKETSKKETSNKVNSNKESQKENIKKETIKKENTKKPTSIPSGLVLPKLQPAGTLQVYYLDVAQGDSTLIRTPKGQYILIDGGNVNQGTNVVSYLKNLGVKKLDVMIATHPDDDHIGGLTDVLKSFDVQEIYAPQVSNAPNSYKDFLTAVKNKGITIQAAQSGVSLSLDGIDANFLSPRNDDYGDDLNAWSAVLRVNYKDTSFLFTGDAESKTENELLADGPDLMADVLMVGQHGAKTSTSKAFVDLVNPKYAIISVGKNSDGYPDSGILARLKNINATTFQTDKQGTITAISNGSKITFVTTKK